MADVLSKVSTLKVEAILFLRAHSSHLIFLPQLRYLIYY
jgi:hypothetical protein